MIRVVHPGSRIRMLTFYPSRIPDPGVKKAPNPGSGSATLVKILTFIDAEPGSGMEKFGSVIRDKHPGSAELYIKNEKGTFL